jgi:hypothetical protein
VSARCLTDGESEADAAVALGRTGSAKESENLLPPSPGDPRARIRDLHLDDAFARCLAATWMLEVDDVAQRILQETEEHSASISAGPRAPTADGGQLDLTSRIEGSVESASAAATMLRPPARSSMVG